MLPKKRISVILPKQACIEIRERMLKEGYSLRGKSKWYSEAIETFIETPKFQDYVQMAALVEECSQVETIHILDSLAEKLEHAIMEVRKEFPIIEGVKSLIVRASVVRRLLTPVKAPASD